MLCCCTASRYADLSLSLSLSLLQLPLTPSCVCFVNERGEQWCASDFLCLIHHFIPTPQMSLTLTLSLESSVFSLCLSLSPYNTPPFFPLFPAPFLSAFLLWVALFCFQGSQAFFPDGTQTLACRIRLLCQAQTLRLLRLKSCLHFKHRKQNNTGRRVPELLVI